MSLATSHSKTTSSLKPKQAARELARRELARRRFVEFERYVAPYYVPAKHHRRVAEMLELVEVFIATKGAQGIGRLLILEPPRHGKSEQASRHFPAWVLGRNPDMRVIVTSYGLDLAEKFSRAARDIVQGERFANVFGNRGTVDVPVEIAADAKAVRAWDLAAPHRGGLVAAGVGGGITGMGAHLFIVDDPFKNREEAESEGNREKVWEWWTSTAYTRLEDGAAVVGMLTRWHGDDWAGRLLKAMASDPRADQYMVIDLPAIYEPVVMPEGANWAEFRRERLLEGVWVDNRDPLGRKPGEPLWPEKYGLEDLERIRVNVGPYDFAALYQQQPYSRVGGYFRREWFALVESPPAGEEIVKRVRYWDKAASKGGDYSAGVLMSLTKGGVVYVEHVARGRWSPMQREEEMVRCAELDLRRPGRRVEVWHQQDPGSAGVDSAQATNRKLAARGITAHFEPVTGDKETRAGPWSSGCEGGMVRLVRGGWNEAFIEEHLAFPKGTFDDQVDSGSSAFTKLVGRTGSGIWV